MSILGEWKYIVDREATRLAYAQADRGGVDTCDCNGCRNFRVARDGVFPPRFLALLDKLGIDPQKDGEIYHAARLAPGHHVYGGWYHFIGSLDERGDSVTVDLGPPDFKVYLCQASAPRLASLKDKPVVQLEIQAYDVPWLLDEPEAE
jgi:hypothetical protein